MKRLQGYTLSELLIALGVCVIVSSIAVVLIRPATLLSRANNAQRAIDVNRIADALSAYATDHGGAFPPALATSTERVICRMQATSTASATCANLSFLVREKKYILTLPLDPTTANATGTGYVIGVASSTMARIFVGAPGAELGQTIRATR